MSSCRNLRNTLVGVLGSYHLKCSMRSRVYWNRLLLNRLSNHDSSWRLLSEWLCCKSSNRLLILDKLRLITIIRAVKVVDRKKLLHQNSHLPQVSITLDIPLDKATTWKTQMSVSWSFLLLLVHHHIVVHIRRMRRRVWTWSSVVKSNVNTKVSLVIRDHPHQEVSIFPLFHFLFS